MKRALSLSLCVVAFLACRGDEARSSAPKPGAIPAVQKLVDPRGRKVIFVGLDGADWQLLDQYMAGGRMPQLAKIVSEGSRGVLRTIHPPLSPLVWTTMMTGRSPLDHRILDFTRFNPSTHDREPITSDERRVPALWNLATMAGKSSAVIGLWATYPAEPIDGSIVSDRFLSFQDARKRAADQRLTQPPALASRANSILQNVEAQVGFEALRAYVPALVESDYVAALQERNPFANQIASLRRVLVETEAYHAIALDTIREQSPDIAIVYVQGTDTIGHLFAPYVAPRQPDISEADFARYNEVPQRYFMRVDGMLGDYARLAEDENAILVIASDHGFEWGDHRPTQPASFNAATAGRWHRDEGIVAIWDPSSKKAGPRIDGGVAQICSTLADLAGIPRADGSAPSLLQDRDGAKAFEYRRYFHVASSATNTPGAPDDIAKLKALGYIGSAESMKGNSASTRTPASYNNEGLLLREASRDSEAREAFERALAIDPAYPSALWNLSSLLYASSEFNRADDLLISAVDHDLPDGERTVIDRAIDYRKANRIDRSITLLDRAVAIRPRNADLWLFRGRYRLEKHDCVGAHADFDEALALKPANALALASRAMSSFCIGDEAEGMRDVRESLRIDPNQPELRRMLGK